MGSRRGGVCVWGGVCSRAGVSPRSFRGAGGKFLPFPPGSTGGLRSRGRRQKCRVSAVGRPRGAAVPQGSSGVAPRVLPNSKLEIGRETPVLTRSEGRVSAV